jgi:voltage-gated potassium channel
VKATVRRSGLRSGALLHSLQSNTWPGSFQRITLNATPQSFFGIVDLLAVAPIYLSLLFGVTHSFAIVRSLRLLRVFRILKLSEYIGVAANLRIALRESLRKITVFLFVVVTIVVVVSALMFQIEGEAKGFTSIPASMYWAIVTVTTVGYGDISPKTVAGRILASILMIVA